MKTKPFTKGEALKLHTAIIRLALAGLLTDNQKEQIKTKLLKKIL